MQLNQIPINEFSHLKDKGYSNGKSANKMARHRWYIVKEAFSPSLVKHAFQDANLSAGDCVIDPFSGSGTTGLEAAINGYESFVFEVNPFLSFVTNVKTSNYNKKVIYNNIDKILKAAHKTKKSNLENTSTFCESSTKKKWLFNKSVLRSFESSWESTNGLPSSAKKFFRLALLDAVMDNCNAIKDGKCLRYRKNWQNGNLSKNSFIASLTNSLGFMIEDLEVNPRIGRNIKIYNGDVRKNLKIVGQLGKKFKLCITSPPYLNSFDYSDIYRPELFLGKFISNNEELMTLRLKTVRSHVQANWTPPLKTHFGHIFDSMFQQVTKRVDHLWDKRIPVMIQAYFEDMAQILRNLKACALADATIWLVVSTSAYAGIEIPVDLILAELAQREGWYLNEVAVLRYLRAAGQHWNRWAESNDMKPKLRESVVILKNRPSL